MPVVCCADSTDYQYYLPAGPAGAISFSFIDVGLVPKLLRSANLAALPEFICFAEVVNVDLRGVCSLTTP